MEKQDRERRKDEERMVREKQRQQERFEREERRENERREKFLQKESLKVSFEELMVQISTSYIILSPQNLLIT